MPATRRQIALPACSDPLARLRCLPAATLSLYCAACLQRPPLDCAACLERPFSLDIRRLQAATLSLDSGAPFTASFYSCPALPLSVAGVWRRSRRFLGRVQSAFFPVRPSAPSPIATVRGAWGVTCQCQMRPCDAPMQSARARRGQVRYSEHCHRVSRRVPSCSCVYGRVGEVKRMYFAQKYREHAIKLPNSVQLAKHDGITNHLVTDYRDVPVSDNQQARKTSRSFAHPRERQEFSIMLCPV